MVYIGQHRTIELFPKQKTSNHKRSGAFPNLLARQTSIKPPDRVCQLKSSLPRSHGGILGYSPIRNILSQKVYFAWRFDFGNRALSPFLQQQTIPAETKMHDSDGIPSRRRVKNPPCCAAGGIPDKLFLFFSLSTWQGAHQCAPGALFWRKIKGFYWRLLPR